MKARFLALAALVLGLASCQTEPEGLDVNVGGEVDTVVTVSFPETTRANSALGAFENVDWAQYTIRYQMKIYDANGRVSDAIYETYLDGNEGNSVTFPVRLVPGREYSFVAWADIVKDTDHSDLHYDTTNLMNITLKDTWVAMDETRDAYTDVETLTYYGNTPVNLQLIRPFAKLRVVTTDMVALNNLDIVPTKATVEYTVDHYNAFNALAGSVIGDSKNRDIKHEEFSIKSYGEDVQNGADMTLFTDYFFAKSEEEPISFILTVYDQNGVAVENIIKTNNFSTDIPVQRNYLTTIQGNVLTDSNNVKVTVVEDGKFAGEKVEKIVEVGNATDLQEAINESTENTTIVLGGDINLDDLLGAGILSTRAAEPTYGLLIPADKEVVLDLKGYTISQEKEQTGAYAMIDNKGTLTIEDSSANKSGKIAYGDNGNGGNYVSNTISNSGVLTINGGTIENNSSATVASNGYPHPIDNSGVLTINGGTFTNNANYSSMRIWCTTDDDTIVTINGGTFNGSIDFQTPNAAANKGTLIITGGTFNADTYTKCAVRLLGFGADVDEMNGYISGGQFNGAIALKNWSGSELNSKVFNITGGTFTVDPSEFVDDDYKVVENNGVYTLELRSVVAKVGDAEYRTLAKAVAAVEDGGTITIVANVTFDELTRTHNSGNWYDGLYYIGDKGFTIDLNGKTISHDGSVNDYLLNFKNDGSKANTINIKNGTLDAGTSAYCALCTSSSNESKITINLENVNLVGNNSGGAVAKIRGGAELNVKAGTVITGNNNYVGIEAAGNNTVVNIFEGVNIYQNGTSSYVGAIVGASQNATMNIYGGYGKSAKCGIIVMSTGATINVSGGEWIANNDGTVANDNNAVLVSQNNRYESSWACKSIINVTGGTFKGGYNCYGMGPGVEPDDAQINIKGGNFNANPASYVVAGYESVEENGVYTVGMPKDLADFVAAIAEGGEVTLSADITLLESVKIEGKKVVLDLNGKTVTAPLFSAFEVKSGAELTIKNGKVVAYESTVRAIGGKAIIESGEYTSTGTALDSPATYRYSLDCREGGELIINGGTFKSNNGMINVSSTVTINGGKFQNVVEKSMTRHFAYVSAPLTINDGEFLGKANGGAGGCFFCGAAAGCDIQVNGGKFTSLWTSGSVNRIFEVYYGGTINVTGGMFNTNGGIASFVTENTDEATKAAYPYVAK